MGFLNEIKKAIDSDPEMYGRDQEQYMHKTGFDNFDYLNGMCTKLDDGTNRYSLGVDAGKIMMIIGKSGSGKSTFAIQTAYNIIRKYENGSMYIYDFEQSNTENRIRSVTGMSESYYRDHVSIKKIGISAEAVLSLAIKLRDLKIKNEEELLVDNAEGILDETGRPVKILPPTIIIVDSLATCLPKAQVNEEMAGQMQATAVAKTNTALVKHLTQICAEGNIIVMFINHITEKVNITMMPTQAQVNYLKPNENLPGGLGPIYLTSTLVKITTGSKLEEDKSYGIKGFEAKIELIKSRTAPAGSTTTMIYNQREGFDNELSLLEYIKNNDMILGNGKAYRLAGLENVTFRSSNFKEVLASNEEFRNHFYSLGRSLLEKSLRASTKVVVPEATTEDMIETLVEESETYSDDE
jgi:RecA/RadA recombinase